jgi:hypothetical protein
MAVLIEGISVVIRADAILNKFQGGWDGFVNIVPNETLCADGEIARVGFMTRHDVESFVKGLQSIGLEFLRDGEAIDIAVADQLRGITSTCSWLEFGHTDMDNNGHRIAACRMKGSEVMEIVTPPEWKFENSLSATFGLVPDGQVEKSMKFLRHEGGMDVYLNLLAGKEVFVGRTGE